MLLNATLYNHPLDFLYMYNGKGIVQLFAWPRQTWLRNIGFYVRQHIQSDICINGIVCYRYSWMINVIIVIEMHVFNYCLILKKR